MKTALLLLLLTAGMQATDLPPAAAAAIRKMFPSAEVTGVGRERERGAWYYEANLRDGGKRIEVEVTEEGVIGEVEGTIPFDELPADVQTRIKARVGDGQIRRIELHERYGIARGGKFVPLEQPRSLYEVKYTDAAGQRREVQVAGNAVLDVPAPVQQRLSRDFPTATIDEIEAEDDSGVPLFVAQLTDNGQRFEVVLDGRGRVVERETPVAGGDISPAAWRRIGAENDSRDTDTYRTSRRDVFAIVEHNALVPRRDVLQVVRVDRDDRTREYRFDGRGKLITAGEWRPRQGDDDEDDDDEEDDD